MGNGNNGDVILFQGKLWWVAGLAMAMLATSDKRQAWNCSLPPTPAQSLICLNQGLATASPSCLGGGWSSVVDLVLVLASLPPVTLGLQAMPAGPSSTR